jgi:hypothetical protein
MSSYIKYLAPWHKYSSYYYYRYPVQAVIDGFLDWKWRAELEFNKLGFDWWGAYREVNSGAIQHLGRYNSLQQAQNDVDEKLLELGYVFLTIEQYEKVRVLL